jgi:WD40 repeat protein
MRRWFLGVCCWMMCGPCWMLVSLVDLRAEDAECIPPSVIELSPLAGQAESPVITAMAIAPNAMGLAVAGDDHSIRLLDPVDGRSVATAILHKDWVRSLVYSPGGRRLASCGHDGEVRVWEIDTPKNELRLLTQKNVNHAVFGLAFATENELYAVGFADAVYRLDIEEEAWSVDHRCDCNDLRTIDISKDGRWMAYGGRDGIVRLHGLVRPDHLLTSAAPPTSSTTPKLSTHLHYERILSIRFSDDSKSIFSCGEDRRLVQWEPSSNRILASLDVQAGKLMAICQLENGWVAVSGSDNTIRIMDLRQSKNVAKLVGHDGSVAVLQRTASHLFSSGFDTTVRTWNIEEAVRRMDATGRFVHPVSAQFEDSSSQEPIR